MTKKEIIRVVFYCGIIPLIIGIIPIGIFLMGGSYLWLLGLIITIPSAFHLQSKIMARMLPTRPESDKMRKIGYCKQMLHMIDDNERSKTPCFLCPLMMGILGSVSDSYMSDVQTMFPEFEEELSKERTKKEVYPINWQDFVWDGKDYDSKREFLNKLIKRLS